MAAPAPSPHVSGILEGTRAGTCTAGHQADARSVISAISAQTSGQGRGLFKLLALLLHKTSALFAKQLFIFLAVGHKGPFPPQPSRPQRERMFKPSAWALTIVIRHTPFVCTSRLQVQQSPPCLQHGLGLTAPQLAWPLSCAGATLVCFALLVYPPLQRRVGPHKACRLGLACAAPCVLLVPTTSLLPL